MDYNDLTHSYRNEMCDKISDSIDNMIYSNLCINSQYLQLNYLRVYLSTIATRYVAILHQKNKIKTREDVQKVFDEIMSITLYTINDARFHYKLYYSISVFVTMILKQLFPNIDEFCVTPSPINNGMPISYINGVINTKQETILIIEPIIFNNDSKAKNMSDKITYDFISTVTSLICYDSDEFKVYPTYIMSNLWISEIDKTVMLKDRKIQEILPNNNLNINSFNSFRAMMLKNEYNIDVDIEYDYEDVNSDILEADNDEINDKINDEINKTEIPVDLISDLINNVYMECCNIKKEQIIKKTNIEDTTVYGIICDKINSNPQNITDDIVSNTIKNIYGNINENNIKDESNNVKNNKDIINNEYIINNIEYKPIKNKNGYIKYIGDYLDKNTNKFIMEFTNYINDMLILVKKSNKQYGKDIIFNMVNGFHHKKYNYNINSVTKYKNKFNVKLNFDDKTELLLTINNVNDKIDDIKYKRINNENE